MDLHRPFVVRVPALAVVIGLLVTGLMWPSEAEAQHRARVSRGLEQTLAAGGGDEARVIYEGPQSEV